MVYVALLRGINVGGKNKIDMKALKVSFEKAGMLSVKTYINSGNVIFIYNGNSRRELQELLEGVISSDFDLNIKVLLRDRDEFRILISEIPAEWQDDKEMKSNIMFLWDEIDSPVILNEIRVVEGVDRVRYIPGTLLWSLPREKTTKSGLMKIAGSSNYKKMTIRNVNTVRKIYRFMEETNSKNNGNQ